MIEQIKKSSENWNAKLMEQVIRVDEITSKYEAEKTKTAALTAKLKETTEILKEDVAIATGADPDTTSPWVIQFDNIEKIQKQMVRGSEAFNTAMADYRVQFESMGNLMRSVQETTLQPIIAKLQGSIEGKSTVSGSLGVKDASTDKNGPSEPFDLPSEK